MHERHTKIEYMECLPKRDFQTILPIIQKRCEIGTIIVTDSYGVYGRLEDYGYPHYTFENSFAFQNQQNKELHIRGAMLSWNWVRYNVKKRNRAAKHLQEHIFEHL